MAKKAPGKAHRKGLTIVQLMDMFPTEESRHGVVRIGNLARRSPLPQVRIAPHQ